MFMTRFALISTALPPSQSGQSTVLFQILRCINPDKYCLITQKNFHQYSIKPKCSTQLTAHYYYLSPDYQFVRLFIGFASLIHSITLLNVALKMRIRQIKKIVRNEQCDTIIACTGDLLDPPAAFIVSKDLGIPFILYTFDYYSFHGTDPLKSAFATSYEPELVKKAVNVIVPNDCMHREYQKRYGINAVIIHNPLDIKEYETLANNSNKQNNSISPRNSIVYTGAIYDAHYDAFRNLIAAIESSENKNLRIHLYTPQSLHRLIQHGITGPTVIVHKAQPVSEMPAIQQAAGILFLPLSFDPQLREFIKTTAPGKLGEYLASKRPILVHAPKDSFISKYFTKYRCGIVVDENNPELLAHALKRLEHDDDLCSEITKNAYERALIDFDVNTSRKKFLALINKIEQ